MAHARSWAAGFVTLVVVAFALTGVAAAVSIPIANFSFENLALGDGLYTNNVVADWISTGPSGGAFSTGVFNPTTAQIPGPGATDGAQVGYGNTGGALSQVLGAVLTANTLYTLQVDILSRIDSGGIYSNQSSTLELRTAVAGDLLASSTISFPIPLPGFNALQTITFLALPTDPNLGETLKIVLKSDGDQSDWDNVRLDATAVPEPTTLLLWGTAAAGLGAAWRRLRGRSLA